MTTLLKTGSTLLAIAAVAAGVLWVVNQDNETPQSNELAIPAIPAPPVISGDANSPFTVATPDEPQSVSGTATADETENTTSEAVSAIPALAIDVTALGQDSLSEDEMQRLIRSLRANPELLQRLIDEIRQETDPARRARLLQILGDAGSEDAMLVASELIFSGDAESRQQGLSLLRKLQPDNPQVRDMVSGMLATEVEPEVLTGTLSALADPGNVDEQSRAYLSDQIAWLTDHPDENVRGVSLDVLSRWTTDGQFTSVLLAGLDDESEHVRVSAAYALADHEDNGPVVIDRLLRTINNPSESTRVRQAAILAARQMPITDVQRTSLTDIERQLNTVAR